MLQYSAKALTSQPQWHGEADQSSPLILIQAYHLILLVDLANGWMAFKVQGQWYRHRVLPFGLKFSLWIFPKLTRLLLWHWRTLGGIVAAYKPIGRTMTKASLVGTLGSLMGVALLIQLYLREAYVLIGQPRWRAPVQLTQVVVSNLAWIGSHIRMLYGVPLWMLVKVLVPKPMQMTVPTSRKWVPGPDHMAEEAK